MDPLKSKTFSVSESIAIATELLQEIKITVIGEVCELSDSKAYKAVYFSLKDDKSVLPCIMWRNIFDYQDVELEEGTLVEMVGRFSLYAPKGRFNFQAYSITLAGEGKLRASVEQLKKKLESEGLFDDEHKKELPDFISRVGLITSDAGAAVHDVIKTLRRENAGVEVVFYGVKVEGKSAAPDMREALQTLDNEKLDVILLVRGGGSYEDLMPFNDEELARTIFETKTPLITGVGHDPDTTIVDYVADVRANTPTGAAQIIAGLINDLRRQLGFVQSNLEASIERRVQSEIQNVRDREQRLSRYSPAQLLDTYSMQLDFAIANMLRIGNTLVGRHGGELTRHARRLEDLSPLSILERGYAYVRDMEGHVIKAQSCVEIDDDIDVVRGCETLRCKVIDKIKEKVSG